jgi:hypothetical protein
MLNLFYLCEFRDDLNNVDEYFKEYRPYCS